MGGCISFNKKIPHPPKPHVMREPDSNNKANRAPPPPCLEEETVKEVVLSETPLPKPQQNPKENTTQMAIIQERNNVEAIDLNLIINKHDEEEEEEEMSQVSEIYSISESFSTTNTATTTTVALTEIKEDEATSKATNRQLNYRSPAKVPRKRPNAGEISRRAKSPANRADSSSPVMSRPFPGRTVPRNVGPSGARRESGGGFSSRRMRSPATETAGGVGRRSPGKVTSERSGGKLKMENAGKKEEVNDGVLVEKSELNDHPHVSLECFIFL